MTAFQWWRSWHGAPMDPKYSVIAARAGVKAGLVACTMWALLDYASQHDPRGYIDGFDTETLAVFTGFPETEIIATIKALHDKEILLNNYFVNWPKRQPKREDDSYDRVTRFRELKRNVTHSNAIPEEVTTDKDKDKEKNIKTRAKRVTPPALYMDSPAVKAYRDYWKKTQNEEQRKLIAESIADIALWNQIFAGWRLHDWKPGNVPGMVDAYNAGGIKSNGHNAPAPRPHNPLLKLPDNGQIEEAERV